MRPLRLHETYGEQGQDFAARERHKEVDGNGLGGDRQAGARITGFAATDRHRRKA